MVTHTPRTTAVGLNLQSGKCLMIAVDLCVLSDKAHTDSLVHPPSPSGIADDRMTSLEVDADSGYP